MQVILLEKVGKLGAIGDLVTVKPGYGRNFLIPFGKALPATESNIKMFEERRAELEQAAADRQSEAQSRATKLTELESVTIEANAGEEGKLFGSIGTRDIAEAVSAAGVAVTKSEVRMPEGSLREVGEYSVDIQFHSDVTAAILVKVVAG